MTYGRMKILTRWHEPRRGFFLIEEGEKVRKVKPNSRREQRQIARHEARGETVCVVRLCGARRVIHKHAATWDDDRRSQQ